MTPPVPPVRSKSSCFECGAVLDYPAKPCWMCGAEQPVMATVVDPAESPFKRPADDLWLHVAFWVLALLSALIVFGIVVGPHYGDQTLQIVFAVAVLPPLGIGLFAAAIARQQGKPMSLGAKTILLAGISGITVPLAAVVFLYLIVVAIQQTCFPSH
jgi:hypothetical protein